MIELDPKVRFLADEKAAQQFLTLTRTPLFQDALQVALAEFVMRQPKPEGLENACRAHYQLEGAKRFLDILMNLGEPDAKAAKTSKPENLIWTRPRKEP